MKFWWTEIKELKKNYNIENGKLLKAILETNKWKERVDDIERRVEKNYGIKIRYETINVNVDFSKVELAVMLAGIDSMLKETKHRSDIQFYAELKIKIQETLDKMEDN